MTSANGIDQKKKGFFDRLCAFWNVTQTFAPIILKKTLPFMAAKLIFLGLKAQKYLPSDDKEQAQNIDDQFQLIRIILDFKQNNPEEFETIFEILDDLEKQYQKDPKKIQDEITTLIQG